MVLLKELAMGVLRHPVFIASENIAQILCVYKFLGSFHANACLCGLAYVEWVKIARRSRAARNVTHMSLRAWGADFDARLSLHVQAVLSINGIHPK